MPEMVALRRLHRQRGGRGEGLWDQGARRRCRARESGSWRCLYVAEELKKKFPNLQRIAITLRGSISASHNTWSGVLYDGQRLYTGAQ